MTVGQSIIEGRQHALRLRQAPCIAANVSEFTSDASAKLAGTPRRPSAAHSSWKISSSCRGMSWTLKHGPVILKCRATALVGARRASPSFSMRRIEGDPMGRPYEGLSLFVAAWDALPSLLRATHASPVRIAGMPRLVGLWSARIQTLNASQTGVAYLPRAWPDAPMRVSVAGARAARGRRFRG